MIYKDYGISLARLIATVAIVICDLFQYFENNLAWWFNVGVNVFLIISGYLYGIRHYDFKNFKEWFSFAINFYFKEYVKVLIPLFIFLLISFPVYCLNGTAIKDFIHLFALKNPGISGFGYMWYFKYILICYFFIPFYYLINDNRVRRIVLIILGALLFFIRLDFIWFCCFIFGAFFSSFGEKKIKRLIELFIIVIGLVLIISCIAYNIDRTNLNMILNIQKLTLGASITFLCIELLTKFEINKRFKTLFDYADKYSYSTFLIHPLFLQGALTVMNVSSNFFLNVCIYVFFIITFSCTFSELSKKVTDAILGIPSIINKHIISNKRRG